MPRKHSWMFITTSFSCPLNSLVCIKHASGCIPFYLYSDGNLGFLPLEQIPILPHFNLNGYFLSHVGMFHFISASLYTTVSNYYSNLHDLQTLRNFVLLQLGILHVWGFPLRCLRFPFGSWISQPSLEQPWPRWGCPALLLEITNPILSSSSPRSWLLEVEWDPGNNYRWCNCLQFNNDWSHARCTCLSYSSKSVRCWSME